jgi:ABC-type transporter Mla subunit MlaD
MRSHVRRREARMVKFAIVVLLLIAWVVGLLVALPAGA